MLCRSRRQNARSRTRTKIPCSKAGDSGDFVDAERHTSKPCCTAIRFERGTERPGIWRPQRWNYYYFRAWISVSALLPKEQKHPQQDPHSNHLINNWVFWYFAALKNGILCNGVNSRFICQSRAVQLGQAETRKNASEYNLQVAFLLRQSACLSSL